MTDERKHLSKEMAEALGVSQKTVDRERRRGRLSWVRVGGRVRFLPAQVAQYIASRTNA